ncbi:hypothetical protein JCM3770_005251 [Rhodotorula araucariae]
MIAPVRAAAPLSKPRQRANTLTSPIVPPPTPSSHASQSPSLSRSYRQPMGTGSLRRQQQHRDGHVRSKSQGDAVAALSASVGSRAKRRAVFCDVVVDELDLSEQGEVVYPGGPAGAFLHSLGERVSPIPASTPQAHTSRPATPAKPRRVDDDRARQSLMELCTTEESYYRKISSLQQHFAAPLRSFAKSRATAIIPTFEANHLFGNIDQLVPIAKAFDADLRNIVAHLQRDKSTLPSGFGEVILQHVKLMEKPYTKWLSNVGAVETLRRELDRTNSSFREYIERTQVVSRETAQTSGGFKEFLAEPHQRIARYRLMLDPILSSLPADDPNIGPLQAAIDLLSAICAMEVDDATKRAAVFWALGEAIDGLPDALVGYDRHFIDAIDVDEVFEVSDPRPTSETLRCTLWLFSDRLLITKRPRGDRTGKNQAGIDDLDRLVQLYQTAHLTSSQATLLGSPKRLRRGVLAYRGVVDLTEVVAVDLGTSGSSDAVHEFGLLLDDPPIDQSSRWNGRPTRRYVIAGTYAPDERAREKECFLARFGETILQQKLKDGAAAAYHARLRDDGSEVYWSVWERVKYERLKGTQKGKLALHVVQDDDAPLLSVPGIRPMVSVRATLLAGSGMCCFEVSSKSPASSTAETIAIDRVHPAIVELGMSYGLYSFPNLRPLSDLGRSRPRSGLLSVFDVFTSGGGLKRGSSMTSRGSSTATTTLDLPHFSDSASPRVSTPNSPQASLSESYRGSLSKKSAPDLYGSLTKRSNDELNSAVQFEDSGPYDGLVDLGAAQPVQPLSTRSRSQPRRSFSLPPPQIDDAVPITAPMSAHVEVALAASLPGHEDPAVQDAVMDATFDSPWRPLRELEAPNTSPMVYRAPPRSASRRRMIGPRDMRAPDVTDDVEGSSPAQHLPFAREHSPAPLRQPHTSNTSTIAYESSPASSDVCNLSFESQPGSAPKRPRPPVEASPRPTPAKKIASLAGSSAGPRAPAPLQPDLLGSARKASGSLLQRRVPSGSSVLNRPRPMSRRVASGASTIRGPATPPRDVDSPDVFSSPAAFAAADTREVTMSDVDQQPFNLLRKHIDDMRNTLREAAQDKENERFVSPTTLTRSPPTRNVFGKAVGSEPAFSSPQSRFSSATKAFTPASESRFRARHLDKQVLAEWTRKLADLVDEAEAAAADAATKPRSPTDGGGSAIEIAVLEQERDLLAAQVVALKEAANKVADEADQKRAALEADNAQLRSAFEDICAGANALQGEFDAALDQIELAVQAAPSTSGEFVALTRQLCAETSARLRAEHELRDYRSSIQAELADKARLEELCRQHGLLA